jgi:hypothetical protein
MLMTKQRRPVIQTLRGWAISVQQEAGAIRECEPHGWMRDCQSALKFDPVSASNFDPFERLDLTIATSSRPATTAGDSKPRRRSSSPRWSRLRNPGQLRRDER